MTNKKPNQEYNKGQEKELELYLHIPFCARKCAYCDFLSAPAKAEEIQKYVKTLEKEIKTEGRREAYADYRVTTLFIGGGTPSILEGVQIASLLSAVIKNFCLSEHAEISMEVNPGTVTEEKLGYMKDAGINRLSIGLQSTENTELRNLGRIHTYEDFLRTFKLSRAFGFDNINVDLMSAIPGQSLKSWLITLEKIAGLSPEHISAYSLIMEEGTPFYTRYSRGELALPDEDTERLMYEETEAYLKKHGYFRYEISNYARPGYECRHNLGYWERKDYLGLGLGASSLVGHARFRRTDDIKSYSAKTEAGEEPVAEREILSLREEMEEFMFLGLRKMEGIKEQEFARMSGKNIREVYGNVMDGLVRDKLLKVNDGRLCLTDRGIDVSNYVFEKFLLES